MNESLASKRGPGHPRVVAMIRLLVLAALALVLMPAPAAAYIDPVSGSVLIQIVSAAVLAGVATVARARHWLVSLFRGRRGQNGSEAE